MAAMRRPPAIGNPTAVDAAITAAHNNINIIVHAHIVHGPISF